MIKHLLILSCLVLLASTKAVLADSSQTFGLTLAVSAGDQRIPPAPNSPIWIDLTVTNAGKSQFNGGYRDRPNNGAMATTSPITDSVRKNCINNHRSGGGEGFVLDPGKTIVLHMMLNNMLPTIDPGVVAGWIVLPLTSFNDFRGGDFALVAPFSVKVGQPLTPEQLTDASSLIATDIVSANRDLSDEALKSLDKLPDHYIVQTLTALAAKAASYGTSYGTSYVDMLGNRPRTTDDIKALQDISQFSNPELSALAKKYLENTGGNNPPTVTAH